MRFSNSDVISIQIFVVFIFAHIYLSAKFCTTRKFPAIYEVITCSSRQLTRRAFLGSCRFVPYMEEETTKEDTRKDLPGSSRGRKRAVEWLRSSRTPTSRMTAGRGTEDASSPRKQRATASQGANSNRLGPTAPRSGSTISRRGSTAPRGGPPTNTSSDDSESSSADDERFSDSQSR